MESRQTDEFQTDEFQSEHPTLLLDILAPHLNLPDLGNLMLTNRSFCTLFKKPHDAVKLLSLVMSADWDKAAEIVDKNPGLMFQAVHHTYPDGRTEFTTPLRYAFKVYDTYMWKMFEKKIREKCPEKMEVFNEQLRTQKEYINLQPLYDAYEEYGAQAQDWQQEKIDDTVINLEWLKVGKAQRDFLPIHMLKEFLRKGVGFDDFVFGDLVPPRDVKFLTGHTTKVLLSSIHVQRLGIDGIFLAGSYSWGYLNPVARGPFGVMILADHLAIIHRMHEARKNDLAKQQSLISQSQEILPSYGSSS